MFKPFKSLNPEFASRFFGQSRNKSFEDSVGDWYSKAVWSWQSVAVPLLGSPLRRGGGNRWGLERSAAVERLEHFFWTFKSRMRL